MADEIKQLAQREEWPKPERLPAENYNVVLARAQRILDLRGEPPYSKEHVGFSYIANPSNHEQALSDDELKILSDFVYFWRPLLVRKK